MLFLQVEKRDFNSKHYLSLLVLAIFGTYHYLIFHGDFILLDDMTMMNRLLNAPVLDLKTLFFPTGVTGYYRPIIELSYRLDHFLWFDIASGYYLTNIMLHALNACCVYAIAVFLFGTHTTEKELIAFFAASLFAVNPLTCESVSWISGRSDLLAATFMLSSFALYLLFVKNNRYVYLAFSGLLFMLGAMTKEVTLALPILVILFELFYGKQFIDQQALKRLIIPLAFFAALTAVYVFLLRGTEVDTSRSTIGVTSSGLTAISQQEKVILSLATVGFYIKKMFVPYPLNFAIHDINTTYYAGLGVCVLGAFLVWGILRPKGFAFFGAWILVTVSPAVAAAVLHIPWVQWAERYLYVPVAGFSLATGMAMAVLKKKYGMPAVYVFLLLIGIYWSTTALRSHVWADELKLWEDTSKKSDFAPVYYLYGKALLNRGREEEGLAQMEKAVAKGYPLYPLISMATIHFKNHEYDLGEKLFKTAIQKFPNKPELHEYLAESYLQIPKGEKNNTARYYKKAIDEFEKYLEYKYDIRIAFKVAVLFNKLNESGKAVPYLERIIQNAPDSQKAIAAARLIDHIRKGNAD